MSGMYIRQPVRSRNQLLSQKKPLEKRRKPLEKPPWDDTTKDLSVFKLSNKEIQRKHELHKPKKDHERLMRKMLEAKLMMMADGYSFNTTMGTEQNETGIDENEASFLEEHERVYKGLPHVTKAPNHSEHIHSFIQELEENDMSYYDVLSKSVVKQPELNYCSDENYDEDDEESSHDHGQENSAFQPNLDLSKYKQILDESYSMIQKEHAEEDKRRRILKDSDKHNRRQQKNDMKTKKSCLKQNQGKENMKSSNSIPCNNNSLNTFDDMKQMLSTLEEEIEEYEKESGKNITNNTTKNYDSCGGYTATLLSTLTRLIKHLKESERQLRKEMAMRQEILIAFEEQKSMIDALTADLFDTQEENKKLKFEVEEIKNFIQTQFTTLKREMDTIQKKVNDT